MENFFASYSPSELIGAMLQYVSNQKKCDKGSIAYKIGMIDHWAGLYASHSSRAEIIARFKSLLNEKTIYQVIKSEYTINQLLPYLSKK